MFDGAKSFKDKDLSGWDVSNVKNHDNFIDEASANNITLPDFN